MALAPPPRRLVECVLLSIDEIGIARTILNIEAGRKKLVLIGNVHSTVVLQNVSKEFNIEVDEILKGTGRRNDRLYAIGFCAYYLHHIFGYEMEDVVIMLDKDISVCYKYSKVVKNLSPRHSSTKKYLTIKNQLDPILTKLAQDDNKLKKTK